VSDYTPTTEEVRNAVWLLKHLDTPLAFPDEAGFDRWLAEVKAQAWEEGYTQGNNDMYNGDFQTPNPYRQES